MNKKSIHHIKKTGVLFLNLFKHLLPVAAVALLIGGCTTQDFEYAGKNEDVYRLKVENTSNVDITYTPLVSVYHLEGKKVLDLPNGTIAPDDPAELVFETEKGTLGVSIDVEIDPAPATLKLSLLKGTGTGDNFEGVIVETQNENYVVTIRYGEWY